MVPVWAARSGDRIRVQLEPLPAGFVDHPGWLLRSGEVPNAVADRWQAGKGGEADIWDRLE